ncbi:chitosanase [Clostridium beijerinckii]|uniref:chitosanase n=1 Tax=Clostridium beijerinckii TaxID=1520 RepID=UPI00068447EA|nr:chitosanase [Clostridium beijerinckii]
MKRNSSHLTSLVLLGIVTLSSFSTYFNMSTVTAKADTVNSMISAEKGGIYWLTKEQKHRAEELTSVFENSTTELDYAYGENLGDGRGITCGRAGFCTGTGDAILVVKKYTDKKPDNILAKYLPALTALESNRIQTKHDQEDVSSLDKIGDFISDWTTAAKDSDFRAIQDSIVDELYYIPSAKKADLLGLKFPLSRAELYDAIIQHGNEQNDLDSIDSLIARATEMSGGTPRSNVDEKVWLDNFLNIRKACLSYCYKEGSREEWADSFGRVDVFKKLVKEGNYYLDKPITIEGTDWDGIVVP